ncbi:MAG: hypothetical protein WAM69_16885 [Candidatus Sulfotelmatobacter sp.]
MRKKVAEVLAAAMLAGLLATVGASPAVAQAKQPEGASMPKVGQMAPDFRLHYFDGNDLKAISLSQYRGKKNVVVAFFIFAFTGG